MGKINGYSLFVQEKANKFKRDGKSVNIGRLYKDLSSEWQNMPDQDKQRYKDRAKEYNSSDTRIKNDESPRLSSQTQNQDDKRAIPRFKPFSSTDTKTDVKRKLAPCEDEEREIKKPKIGVPGWKKKLGVTETSEARVYFDQHLFDMYNSCKQVVECRVDFIDTPLYSLSFNVLCKHKKDGETFFIPIEVGIYSYSIKKGRLAAPYHAIIDAGPPPQNYYNAAADHALTHKITFPPKARYPSIARSDYKQIYQEMLEYTAPGQKTIMISRARDYDQTLKCLNWLYNKACEDGSRLPRVNTWKIVPAIEFVAAMHDNIYQGMLLNPSPQFANRYLMKMLSETCTLDYNPAFMCSFHRIGDNQTQWCAETCASKTILSLQSIFESMLQMYKQATALSSLPAPAIHLPIQSGPSCARNQMVITKELMNVPYQLEGEPVRLAIEGPQEKNDCDISLDPRLLRGSAKPLTEVEVSKLKETNPDDIVFFDEDLGLVTEPRVVRKPKPKPDSLIIASHPVTGTNHQSDIF